MHRTLDAFTSFATSLVLMANSAGITGGHASFAGGILVACFFLRHHPNRIPKAYCVPQVFSTKVCYVPGFLSTAYVNGGPVAAVWGWFGVSFTNVLVALSIAEIASAYPIAGGPYIW